MPVSSDGFRGLKLNAPNYFRRSDAARHVRETWGLPCSPRWLAKLAVVGGGPTNRASARRENRRR